MLDDNPTKRIASFRPIQQNPAVLLSEIVLIAWHLIWTRPHKIKTRKAEIPATRTEFQKWFDWGVRRQLPDTCWEWSPHRSCPWRCWHTSSRHGWSLGHNRHLAKKLNYLKVSYNINCCFSSVIIKIHLSISMNIKIEIVKMILAFGKACL